MPAIDEPGVEQPSEADKRSRRVLWIGLLRSVLWTTVIVGAYFILPLEFLPRVSPLVSLPIALGLFVALLIFQFRAISQSSAPGLRAVEGLATLVPVLMVIFAGTYHVIELASPDSFSESLTKLDALYFAVTVFATVGFGDVAATAPGARAAVTIQMAVDLLVLGIGLRIILGAVETARQRTALPPPKPGQ